MPLTHGKVCARHPELNGERRNGNCPACQRERVRTKPSREVQQRKIKKYRAANRENYLAGAKVRTARARARLKEATVGDAAEVGRLFRAYKRRAKLLGLTIDHIVPLAGCRICGLRGLHEPSNWQLISGIENASKGNRCPDCQ